MMEVASSSSSSQQFGVRTRTPKWVATPSVRDDDPVSLHPVAVMIAMEVAFCRRTLSTWGVDVCIFFFGDENQTKNNIHVHAKVPGL